MLREQPPPIPAAGSGYTLPSRAGSAGSAGAACRQLARSPAYGSPDSLHPSEALLQEQLRGSCLHGCSVLNHCKTSDFMLPAHHHSRPDVFLGFLFQQPHGDQRIPSTSSLLMCRTCFKVSLTSLAASLPRLMIWWGALKPIKKWPCHSCLPPCSQDFKGCLKAEVGPACPLPEDHALQ